jgi:hypothetical protein
MFGEILEEYVYSEIFSCCCILVHDIVAKERNSENLNVKAFNLCIIINGICAVR